MPLESAALANCETYDSVSSSSYIDGAPHVKHAGIRALFHTLAARAVEHARLPGHAPRVLDLGAGDGWATLPFLDMGAAVVAVDVSAHQLQQLERWAVGRRGSLTTRCDEVSGFVASAGCAFDVVVLCSVLHHIPDYLDVVRRAARSVRAGGVFLSFQDLMRYDSLPVCSRAFNLVAYASWRCRGGDVLGGVGRRLRRSVGVYRHDCAADNVEYHLVRNGVDQDAIAAALEREGFDARVTTYFSTQSAAWQRLGDRLGIVNTFAVIAKRRH